jgi:hypothetical protein
MTTPNLIVQHRELARSLRELQRQNVQSLDAIAAARDREIAAAEQERLDANRPYDARLAEFLELEKGARAVVKSTGAKAFAGVDADPPLMPITDPVEILTECKSEIERIHAGSANKIVRLRIMDIPSDANQAKVKKILGYSGEVPVPVGHEFSGSLRRAREIIPKLKELGIEAEFVV